MWLATNSIRDLNKSMGHVLRQKLEAVQTFLPEKDPASTFFQGQNPAGRAVETATSIIQIKSATQTPFGQIR